MKTRAAGHKVIVMRKRVYLIVAISMAIASLVVGFFALAQIARTQRARVARTGQRGAPGAPLRAPDPNRAPGSAVDDALYLDEEFFGEKASIERPYRDAFERISTLAERYPKDARVRLHAARLAERLGQFDRAVAEMEQYASIESRSPNSLRRLAAFYGGRARHADHVKALVELARSSPIDERSEIYKEAAEIVRSRAVAGFSPAAFFSELAAADPSNPQPVKDYVRELRLEKRHREALDVLSAYQPKFPADLGYFLKTRSEILESLGDRRGAEDVYSSTFDPTWPQAIAADYFDLLRRFGRYRRVRRELQDRVRAGTTDLQPVGRLFSFYTHELNYAAAARLVQYLERKRGGTASDGQPQPVASPAWPVGELKTVAAMLLSISDYDQASRYLYTLYLNGGLAPGSRDREEALEALFKVLIDARGSATRIGGGDLSFYRDVAEVDQHPGFLNGVLSLVLAGTSPADEFEAQESRAFGYFNRALAYRIFNTFKQEYPQSALLDRMYEDALKVLSSIGEYRRVIATGREFQQRFPGSRVYANVSLQIADAHVALKDRAGERAVLGALLDRLAQRRTKGLPLVPFSTRRWRPTPDLEHLIDRLSYEKEAYSDTYDPTEGEGLDVDEESEEETDVQDLEPAIPADEPTYSSVLERYVSSLAVDNRKIETVAFFWGEIRKHPREEGLYERFLRWLGQAELVNEQLRAYNSAIRRFDSSTWYHRLARWYVRHKRAGELARYSRRLINIFDEEDVNEYLLRFAGYGADSGADELNWDQRLAFDLYSYAHTRFPRNLFFVRGMLDYLGKSEARSEIAQWGKLSARYYFADSSIRDAYLRWQSRQGRLRELYQNTKQQSAAGTRGTAYGVFAADAAAWLSRFDEAVGAYRHLTADYPGQPRFATRLAELTRSLGQQSADLYEESARVLGAVADIYPTEHSYRIKAGEAYAEMNDFTRAGEQWEKMIQLEPGERNTYLEVATVFWDYYQFDSAIDVLKKLRQVTGDPTIYAYRLGAVYEGKGDLDSAIAEYVSVLSEPGEGRDTAASRLAQLARRPGLGEKIAARYAGARAASPADWQLVLGYALYLAKRDQHAEALGLLRNEVSRASDVNFLESVRDLFKFLLRPEDEQFVTERLAAVARDERESMMYRLQLASALERQREGSRAIAVIDGLVAEFPTNVGVIEEGEKFYWRAGLRDRALGLLERTLQMARGSNRRNVVFRLARRQLEAERLADAESTLRAYYDENRSDTEAFAELVRTLGAAGKLTEVVELYKSALSDLRSRGSEDQVAEVRRGMIRTLDSLGKHQEALDQHIEIVNRYPEDESILGAALGYAETHGLVDRLTGYYEKLSRESYKNYRWQLVLGRIYEWRGDLDQAAEQYRAAVTNEPQRTDLRMMLASALARPSRGQPRYDEAIAVLREAWTLSGKNPIWLTEVARIRIRQGLRDEAVRTVREALAGKKNVDTEDQMQMAGQLASWGLSGEAVGVYEKAFTQLLTNIKEESCRYEDVAGYVRSLVRAQSAADAFGKIERLRQQYDAIAQNATDTDRYHAGTVVSHIDSAMRSVFGEEAREYSDARALEGLGSAVGSVIGGLKSYGDRSQLLRYAGICSAAGLVDVQEQIYTQIKDAAFKSRTGADDGRPYGELRLLLAFYDRHAAFVRAAEALEAEQARDQFKNRFDYVGEIAARYRLAGDGARELEWLRRVYAAASGSLTMTENSEVGRYFSILYSSGSRNELARLASSFSPYQLQLANFLIEKGEKELARTAIANASQRPAWVASRSAEVGLFLKDTGPETEAFFKNALGLRPIGEMLGQRPDVNQVLVGGDWYLAARNYGFWLAMAGRDESRRYSVGELEGKPASGRAQVEMAAFYVDRKDLNSALQHLALASELDSNDRAIPILRGEIELARDNRTAAIQYWKQIIGPQGGGSPNVGNAEVFLDVMANHSLLPEALPEIESFIDAYMNRIVRSRSEDDSYDRLEDLKPLVRSLCGKAGGDARLVNRVAGSLLGVVGHLPDDLVVGRLVVEEGLLPEPALAGFYRVIHERMSRMAKAVAGTPEYEDGYSTPSGYFYPARELSEWRRRLVDFLIRSGTLDEAGLLVLTIKREQADLAEPEPGEEFTLPPGYQWLPLASALIELRRGGTAAAVAELKQYCKEDLHSCLHAHALLIAEGREAEADELLYEAYTARLRGQISERDVASLSGLAEIEMRRGRAQQAADNLRLIAERSLDNQRGLTVAAETAARLGLYDAAIEYRNQLAKANPDDAVNLLEMARAMDARGQHSEALARLAQIATAQGSPNTVRAQAAESMIQVVRNDPGLAPGVGSSLSAGRNDGLLLARAALAEATGRLEEATSLLSGIRGPLEPVARTKLGRLALAAGRSSDAVTHFERALYLDASGSISGSIAFDADENSPSSARAILVLLYNRQARHEAALRLAGASEALLGDSAETIRPLLAQSLVPQGLLQPVFEPPLTARARSTGLRTLFDMNQAALERKPGIVAALVESALRLGQFDRARQLQRASLALVATQEERATAEKRLAEISAAEKEREEHLAALLRINRSTVSESVYAARVIQ